MSLPYVFANSPASPPLPLSALDANFNAVGFCAVIPCSVSGTNSITLTPEANTPIPVYGPYARFSGIVAATNTGSVLAAVGGLTRLPVYKDTSSGPILLTGGELVAGTLFQLTYDPVLNNSGGGFHVGGATTVTLPAIGYLEVLANISQPPGITGPTGTTVTNLFDAAFGTALGSIPVKGITGSSGWSGSSETSWTPAIAFGGASVGVTYSTQTGHYLALGLLIVGVFNVVLSAVGSSTGAATLSLPWPSGSNRVGSLIVSNYSALNAGVTGGVFGGIAAGSATAALYKTGGAGVATAMTNSDFGATSALSGSFILFTG